MVEYEEIIDKLSNEEKIALLVDSREAHGEQAEKLNIPRLSMTELWKMNEREGDEPIFPSALSLAHSWNPSLFAQVCLCLATVGKKRGYSLFTLPSTNASSSVYGKALTEEPYLAGSLMAEAINVLKKSRVQFCMKPPAYSETEARLLDIEPDLPTLYDRLARPFAIALNGADCPSVLMPEGETEGSYGKVLDKIVYDLLADSTNMIVKVKDPDKTAQLIAQGKLPIGGSSLVIETALENYKRIYRSMEEGGATAQELSTTLHEGSSLSEEMINQALLRKIRLAALAASPINEVNDEELNKIAYESACGSIVLVKNERGALPLSGGRSVCIVGDVASDGEGSYFKGFVDKLSTVLTNHGAIYKGFSQGYRTENDVDKELLAPALQLSKSADTVILMLGLGKKREDMLEKTHRLTLPGNQQALIAGLKGVGKRVIGVIVGEKLPDMSFDKGLDGVIFIPSRGVYVAEALGDIIVGKVNPSGKLAFAGYNDTDRTFREIQERKRQGKQKIGPFVYSRYQSACMEHIKYPVGYGLSYSAFTYSRLSVVGDSAQIALSNTGTVGGYETVQIYVGMDGSSVIRPHMELKATVRVFLGSGEKKSITIPLRDFGIYDTKSDGFVTESGNYFIYLNTGNGVYFKERISVMGKRLERSENRISAYLHTVSNIHTDGYTMEANCEPMKNQSKAKAIGALTLATTFIGDVVYGVCLFMMSLPLMEHIKALAILNGIGIGLGALLLIIAGIKERRLRTEQEKIELEATRELFKTVERVDVKHIEELFEEEFDPLDEEVVESVETKSVKVKDDNQYAYMAVNTDINALCHTLLEFFEDRGIKITPKMARGLLSAILTSRLLVFRSRCDIKLQRILSVLSDFFGSGVSYDCLSEERAQGGTLLQMVSSFDSSIRSTVFKGAIDNAISSEKKVCFVGVDNVRLDVIGAQLMPYVQYFGNPNAGYAIVDNGIEIKLPSNLWVIISPKEGQSIDTLPAYISNLATLVDFEGVEIEAQNSITHKPLAKNQLEALIYQARRDLHIDEELWKGVDALEELIAQHTEYRIGNKVFLQLECYIATYTQAGGELAEAMDSAVASKLLPGILALTRGKESMEEVDLGVMLENYFGESNVSECRRLLKSVVIKTEEAPTEEALGLNLKKGETAPRVDLTKEETHRVELTKKEPTKIDLTKEGPTELEPTKIDLTKEGPTELEPTRVDLTKEDAPRVRLTKDEEQERE